MVPGDHTTPVLNTCSEHSHAQPASAADVPQFWSLARFERRLTADCLACCSLFSQDQDSESKLGRLSKRAGIGFCSCVC